MKWSLIIAIKELFSICKKSGQLVCTGWLHLSSPKWNRLESLRLRLELKLSTVIFEADILHVFIRSFVLQQF
jgi:hypothetical protein